MRIVHFAPFAPNACGLYEAVRDMIVADILSGHDSHLVDTGVTTTTGEHSPGAPGQTDERGGITIKTDGEEIIQYADLFVAHTGIPDNWIVKTEIPMIWVLHGRPAACFKPEQFGRGWSYTLISELAKWPRVKAFLTFWPYHVGFWKVIIPGEKLICFDFPPIDGKRFNPEGPKYDFAGKNNKFNVLISESLREDIDTFELVHGVIEYAKLNKDINVHIFGLEPPLRCWELILQELRALNVLGVVWGRRNDMEEVYRAADIVLSPQRIVTRSVGEALSCGTPVIADENCPLATYMVKINDPKSVAIAIGNAINDLRSKKDEILVKVRADAENISLANFSRKMNAVYERVTA